MSNRNKLINEDINTELGMRIRHRRIAMGLTLKELGAMVGVSSQQLAKYETGSNTITIGRLLLIAKELNVSLGYFFGGLTPISDDRNVRDDYNDHSLGEEFGIAFMKIQNERHKEGINYLVKTLTY